MSVFLQVSLAVFIVVVVLALGLSWLLHKIAATEDAQDEPLG